MAKGKKHSKSKSSKNPAKKSAKNDKGKRKAKFIDPTSSVSREVRETVAALVEQIEREESDTNEVRVTKKKKKTKAQTIQAKLAENEGIEVKSGMTLKQVVKIMDRKNQLAKSNTAGGGRVPDEEEEEGDEDETDEDYSDIANERAKEYRKGGYHPVVVGEIYNNRYRIVKKLGWGYFSTVWLVWDYTEERYHAMKIQKSAKHYSEAAYCEIRLLSEIMKADPNKTRFCTRLNDYFEHSGPNGNHVCMVFDVYGENLLTLMERYEYRGIPLPIVKCIARQVLVALDHIASIDIIHTDLKPENVLLSTPKHSIISLMRHYHPPPLNQRPKLTERDPKTMTKSQRRRYYKKLAKQKEKELNGEKDDTEDDKSDSDHDDHKGDDSDASKTDPEWEVERFHHIILADFGNSCWTYEQFTDEVQTRQYRSPEVILGEPYSTPIDIWSCACMIFELITGEYLFEPKKGDNYPLDEDHLALMTELLGDLPESMRLGDGKYRRQFYNSNGELRNIKDLRYWNLEDVLHTRHNFTRKKAKEIADFLLPMLVYLPESRATPGDILKNFESFFEIQEDDYEPLCFDEKKEEEEEGSESENAEETMESYTSASEEEEEEEGAADDAPRSSRSSYRFWEEHPILNRASLEEKGLTIADIQAVLSGKTLDDPAAHEAAVDVIHLLSEETDRLSASDGHEADQEDEGEDDGAEEEEEESDRTSSDAHDV